MSHGFHKARLALCLLAAAVAAPGCDEGPCPDGCAEGEVCDAEKGRCVQTAADCTLVGCPGANEECDPVEKTCVPVRDCLTEGCPDGQVCDAGTRSCEQRQGCRVDGCAAGLECDLITGECRPPGCRRDGDCKPGRICDGPTAQCVSGCRGEGRCPPGAVCSLALAPQEGGDGVVGECVAGCRTDEDCPVGQECAGDGAGGAGAEGVGECADEPPCDRNEHCRPDEVCEVRTCVRGPCTEGIPCPERAYCDPETGRCLPADCSDDLFEDNDGPDEARRLLPQAYAHLRICPGDTDWYRVEAEEGAAVEATIRFDAQAGDLDLEAYDSDLYRLASSRGQGNPETVRATAGRDGAVLLQVLGVQGAQAQYFLEITVSPAAECDDDDREDNDDFRTPDPLPAGAYDDLILCPDDEDWYAVSVEAGDGLQVSLTTEGAGPPPQLERLGPEGERQTAPAEGSGRSIRLQRAARAGRHLLRVRAEADEPVPYALDLRTHPGGLPCQDDDLEDNDDPDTAAAVVARTYAGLVSCPGDVDWYSVTVERPGGTVAVALHSPEPDRAPALTLFGPEGGQASNDDPGSAEIGPTRRAGEALVRVTPPEDGLPTRYDLSVELTAGPDPCADDPLEGAEGNDGAAKATLLRPGATPGLVLCPESPEDWYAVDIASGGAMRLRVLGDGVSCGLRTTDGARLLQACEGDEGGPTSAAAVGLERGRYRLRVHGDPPAAGLVYRLELEVLP